MFKKRIFTFILALIVAMPVMFMPSDETYGEGSEVWDGSVDITWYEEQGGASQTDYYISEPAQLAGLAALVNGKTSYDCKNFIGDKSMLKSTKVKDFELTGAQGGNQKDTVYVGSSEFDFMGKTIHITKDLDMGGVYQSGKWSGPNWTPIGGKFPMDTRSFLKGETKDVMTIESMFNGVLDGGGHKIKNLYCDRYTDKGYGNSMAIGLVGYIANDYDENPSEKPVSFQPGVRNLTLSGYIYGRRMVGGIVGYVGELSGGALIENCGNHATVESTDSRGRGGMVGRGYGGKIINCYNTGNMEGTRYTTAAGGIIGENAGMSIYNCYNTGNITSGEIKYARGIGSHSEGNYTVANCYFLEGCDNDPNSDGYYKGTSTSIKVDVKSMTEAQMKGADLYTALKTAGDVFEADTGNINNGYPVLYFEKSSYDPSKKCNVVVENSTGGSVSASISGEVPSGKIVHLSSNPESGYMLSKYTANGNEIYADYYTVTSDVTLSANFIKLEKGAVEFKGSKSYSISGKKTGTVLKDGETVKVSNRQMVKGEDAYQLDSVKAKAVLKKGAVPEDENLEFTGEFTYVFTYGDGTVIRTDTGMHDINESISSGLTVTAEPKTREKKWTTRKSTSWYSSSKTLFTLSTPEQLAGFAYLVNTKGYTFRGKTVRLGRDISLRNNDGTGGNRYWTCIGISSSKNFRGTFDGRGYSISSMNAKTEGSYSGLFGYLSGGIVKNVTVKGTSRAANNAAGIVAYGNDGNIYNCVSYVDVSSSGNNAAGIVAKTKGSIRVTECINRGTIQADGSNAGGISAEVSEKADRIRSCANYGKVIANQTYAGGIVGKSTGCIEKCVNYGKIYADDFAGGLAGHTNGWEKAEIESSYNQGSISATKTAGGLVGNGQYIKMVNCYNAGDVQGEKTGSIAGTLNASINNSVKSTYHKQGSDAFGNQEQVQGHEYVSVKSLKESTMKSSSFAATLNKVSKSTFIGKSNSYPVFKWLESKKRYTVTYKGDYTGKEIVYYGKSVQLPKAPDGKAYTFKVGGKSWNGKYIKSSVTVTVSEKDAKYVALIMADGKTIKKIEFTKNTKTLQLPSIPKKSGNDGEWTDYVLAGKNIVINAVYSKKYTMGDVTLSSGYYYVDPSATGVINIKEGKTVTLDGDGESISGLSIYAEKGSTLIIRNLKINNYGTVVTLNNATLKLSGSNSLTDSCTEKDNKNPGIVVRGKSYISGSGSVLVKSTVGNYPIQLMSGSTLTQKSGTVKAYDGERMGNIGGIVNGGSATLRIEGGTFAAVSDTDKIYAAYLKKLIITGGNVLMWANEADNRKTKSTYGKAIYCKSMYVTGGSLKVISRIHDQKGKYVKYEPAIYSSTFTKGHYLVKVRLPKSTNAISVDGKTVYKGSGYSVGFSSSKRVYTTTRDRYAYIWVKNGTHTIKINGKAKKVRKTATI